MGEGHGQKMVYHGNMKGEKSIRLTDRQERFCQEYLKDLNATQAAIRSGYSERTAYRTGCDNLKKPQVLARVEFLKQQRAEKTAITSEWVLMELQRVHARCIVPVEIEKWDKELKRMVGTGEFRFDSNGANRSLELIGKHIGMFKDRVEHTGHVTTGQPFELMAVKPGDLPDDAR